MELHRHYGKGNDDDLKQKKIVLWEKIAAEEIVNQTPYHCRYQEQDKKRMPSLKGTAANRSHQQRYISNYSN